MSALDADCAPISRFYQASEASSHPCPPPNLREKPPTPYPRRRGSRRGHLSGRAIARSCSFPSPFRALSPLALRHHAHAGTGLGTLSRGKTSDAWASALVLKLGLRMYASGEDFETTSVARFAACLTHSPHSARPVVLRRPVCSLASSTCAGPLLTPQHSPTRLLRRHRLNVCFEHGGRRRSGAALPRPPAADHRGTPSGLSQRCPSWVACPHRPAAIMVRADRPCVVD